MVNTKGICTASSSRAGSSDAIIQPGHALIAALQKGLVTPPAGGSPLHAIPVPWQGKATQVDASPGLDSEPPAWQMPAGSVPPATPAKKQPEGAPFSNQPDDQNSLDVFMASMGGANVNENDSSGSDNLVDAWMADRDARQAGDDASTAEEKLFTKAGKTGYFDIRDAVGQRFQREHKKGNIEHGIYSKIANRDEKRLFRESWAKKKFESSLQGKRFEQEYQTIDTTLGEYLTFGAVVIKYGGWHWAPAVAGAKKTAAKCTLLGGKWSMKDEFSAMHMFLVLQKGHGDIFMKKWLEFEEQYNKKENIEGANAPSEKVPKEMDPTPSPKDPK
jgi:hypothetical protein